VLVLRSTRVVTPDGERPATVRVADGRIVAVAPHDAEPPPGARLVELGDDALLPGLVDTHVHVNDPGRTEWEGFGPATRAAAVGGVTTVVDMPLNSVPPTTDVPALAVKLRAAAGALHVDTGFWGGAVPDNLVDLQPLHDAGVFGFKCFLLPSGVDEFPPLPPVRLADAMREVARLDGLLIVHAEDPALIDAAPPAAGTGYPGFLASRPPAAEHSAVAAVVALARLTGARAHVLHLSSAGALPLIAAAKADGVRITVETCPHYLTLTAEEVPDGATEFKCCPPIRGAANRDALWRGLADGTIDCVVSDHSPATVDLKQPADGDFGTAWGGISSLQLGLPAMWTEARRRGHTLTDLARWMSAGPAALVGLARKGAIAPGRDADFAVLATDRAFTVDPAALQHRNPVTAYAGRTLHGVVRATWLRGTLVAEDGVPGPATGRVLRRTDADPAASTGTAAGPSADAAARAPRRPVGWRALTDFTGAARPYRPGSDPYADHRRAAEPADFEQLTDLADRRLSGAVLAAGDEFFAERENLLLPGPAVFDPELFGPKGKLMDGWETRRRRGTDADHPHPAGDAHDWALVRLALPGVVRGLVVDTAHFRGNHPRAVSVEATSAPLTVTAEDLLGPDVPWTVLVPRTEVGGHAANAYAIDVDRRFTHLRLRQYPDGGVARLRAYGEVVPDPGWLAELGTFDLVALEHGGAVEDASDRFYSPPANTIMPGRPGAGPRGGGRHLVPEGQRRRLDPTARPRRAVGRRLVPDHAARRAAPGHPAPLPGRAAARHPRAARRLPGRRHLPAAAARRVDRGRRRPDRRPRRRGLLTPRR
jgi:allantoinase